MYTNLRPYLEDDEATRAQKLAFAEAFLRDETSPFDAAKRIGLAPGPAQRAAMEWPHDPVVIARMDELARDRGAAAMLPTKEEFASEILRQARNDKASPTTKLDFFKLFATVMGYVEKPKEPTANVNVAIVNKVMAVPKYANRDEAHAAIKAQQAKLINARATG